MTCTKTTPCPTKMGVFLRAVRLGKVAQIGGGKPSAKRMQSVGQMYGTSVLRDLVNGVLRWAH